MSRAISNRLAKLEALNLNVTTELVVRRHGARQLLFRQAVPYVDPVKIELRWPERNEAVESFRDHNAPEVEGDLVQHRYTDAAI